jgi:tRNA threonylcarbamoyl adenosine modification protein (Sua5/YciO/YrdC/YwlC family)
MSALRFEIDAEYPRPDRVEALADMMTRGGLIALPTDTTWVVACAASDRSAASKLGELRSANESKAKKGLRKPMSLMCPDVSTVGNFCLLDQSQFRLVRRLLPGPYTIILPASRQVPRQLQSKRRSVGVRIPDHAVATAVLAALGGPMLVTTCQNEMGVLIGASTEIFGAYADSIDAIVETDPIEPEQSTVVDYTGGHPILVRPGKGAVESDWNVS